MIPENGETLARKLNFNIKECETPGRYLPRHKIGEPLMVFLRVRPLLDSERKEEAKQACITVKDETTVELTPPKVGSFLQQ